jgi:hypothetical protein
VYGATEADARTNTIAFAFRVIGERIAHGEPVPLLPAAYVSNSRAEGHQN